MDFRFFLHIFAQIKVHFPIEILSRASTVLNFIFFFVSVSITSVSYGYIAWYGWPYIHGDCLDQIQSYQGYSRNNLAFTIDRTMLKPEIDLTNPENIVGLEHEIESIMSQKLIAGPNFECLVADDCHTKMDVCILHGSQGSPCIENPFPPKGVCAKGYDCHAGQSCECIVGQSCECVPNLPNKCGSQKDCAIRHNCINGTCEEVIPQLNPYGNEYG